MPAGTCHVCGCTEERACEGGCWWADEEQTICSQCVLWVVLTEDRPIYEGVFAYGLVPIRNMVPDPAWNHHTKKVVQVYWLDTRRLDEPTIERVAFVMAAVNGGLAEDMLAVLRGGMRVPIEASCVKFGLSANTLEEAGRRAEEIAQTGKGSGATLVAVAWEEIERGEGGASHG